MNRPHPPGRRCLPAWTALVALAILLPSLGGQAIDPQLGRLEAQAMGRNCLTPLGICALNGAYPLNMPCSCLFPTGPVGGFVVP